MREPTPSLMRSRFFSGLVPASVAKVAARVRPIVIEQGDVIFHEGDQGHSMFLVDEGEFVALQAGERASIKLLRFRPGDFFGVTSLVKVAPRPWTVAAATPGRLLELTDADFAALHKEDVEAYVLLLQNVVNELCHALRGAGDRVTELAEESADGETTQIELDRIPRIA